MHIESSSSAIAEGQTLDLNCVVAGSGPTTVTWYKRGGSLPAGHQVGHGERGGHPKILPCPPLFGPDMFPSCAQQVSGSRLRIPQVSAADSGEYVCRVTTGSVTQETSLVVTIDDDAGRSHRECHAVDGDVQTVLGPGAGRDLTLNSAHTASSVTPPIRIESSASSVTEGQTLDLDCVVAGQGQATFTWYKRSGSLPAKHQVGGDVAGQRLVAPRAQLMPPPATPQMSGSRLRLSQLSVADSGEYVCRADLGSTSREATVVVTVTSRDSSSYRECSHRAKKSIGARGSVGDFSGFPVPCPHRPAEPHHLHRPTQHGRGPRRGCHL